MLWFRFKVTSKKFTTSILHSIITSKPLFLNIFCRCFLIFSICGPLQFLKVDNSSYLYKPMYFALYCCPSKFNKNTYQFTHLSATVSAHRNTKHITSSFHPRLFLIKKQRFTGVIYNLLIIISKINYCFGKS